MFEIFNSITFSMSAHFPFSRMYPSIYLYVRIGPNTGIIETSISPVVRKFSRFRLTDALCITPGESLGHGYFARRVQSSKLGSTLVSNNPSCKAPPTIRIAYSACRSRVTGRFNFTRGKFQNGF